MNFDRLFRRKPHPDVLEFDQRFPHPPFILSKETFVKGFYHIPLGYSLSIKHSDGSRLELYYKTVNECPSLTHFKRSYIHHLRETESTSTQPQES
jgi:hypothetical protein